MKKNGRPRDQVLVISNGHGEDQIGSILAERLVRHYGLTVNALPLVGVGGSYIEAGIPLAVQGADLPSGGFIRHSLRNLIMDVLHGGIPLARRQARALREYAGFSDLIVCVGDCLLICVARLFSRCQLVFLPTAKSDYISPHWPLEICLMRRYCLRVFPRDVLTFESLTRGGVPAEFAGNVMMDALRFKGADLEDTTGARTIALLPGSRAEAYGNMADIAAVVQALEELETEADKSRFRYLVALAGGLSFTGVCERLRPMGWSRRAAEPGEDERGIVGHLRHMDGNQMISLTFTQGRFADVLAAADVVLGLAGTANEQAAGLGKPVVAFPGRGPQITSEFIRKQQRLLGGAVSVVERDPRAAARELQVILGDEVRRERMARAGRERMGSSGGAERITAAIHRLLENR